MHSRDNLENVENKKKIDIQPKYQNSEIICWGILFSLCIRIIHEEYILIYVEALEFTIDMDLQSLFFTCYISTLHL